MMLQRTLKFKRCLTWLWLFCCLAATSAGVSGQTPAAWTLGKLVEAAWRQRADLLAARHKLDALRSRVTQAGARPPATLETEFGTPRFLAGDPEADFAVTFSQPFETGGKRRKRLAVAELELAQAQAEVAALERRAATEVRAAYAQALAAGRELEVLDKLLAASAETLRLSEARVKEGDAAPLDANLLHVETGRLRVQQTRARAAAENSLINLRALVGLSPADALPLALLPDSPPRLDLSLEDLTARALRDRPDLQAARLGEQLGAAQVNLARAQGRPNVEGFARYSWDKSQADLPESLGPNLKAADSDHALTFGVRVELPNRRRNRAAIAEAAAGQAQAQQQRAFLEATIRRDVALAFRAYRAAAETLALYAAQILPRAEENMRSVRAAYQLGEFSALDVVNEQRRLLENQTGYNEAWRDYYTSLAALEAALGAPLPLSGAATILPDERLFRLSKPALTITGQPR
jgi:cobalt-zinc-cadmium efflux system outer membrane protein